MFAEVLRFELRYQLKRRSTWFYFLVINALLAQLTSEAFFGGARNNNYFYNSPFVVTSAAVFASLLGMVMSAAIAGDAGGRDAQLRLAPLLYTTPMGKAAYLGGRFAAAFLVVAALMLSIPIGQYLLLGLPSLDPSLIGPFRPAVYALPYLTLMLPTIFITTALMFSASVLSRRAIASFAVGAALFVSAVFTNAYLAQTRSLWALARMLDPFALTFMSELSRQRTMLQKGTQLIGLEPTLLANRALWISVACLVLAWTFARFSFAQEASSPRKRRWWSRRPGAFEPLDMRVSSVAASAPSALPAGELRFDAMARLRQTLAIAARSFRAIVWSRGFLVVVAVAVIVALTGPELMEHNGVPLVPVTGYIAKALGQASDFFGFVAPLMCIIYAGELVWRERDAGLGAIADATPLPDWVPLLGKGLGLGLALAAWQCLLMGAGMLTQLQMGHTDLQPGLWLQMLFGLGLTKHLLFAVLAIALHVAVNNKYAGFLAGLAAYALMGFASRFGIEHHLLVYTADPGWDYSDMRGFGLSLGPVAWFALYWTGWAVLLALAARLLWVRGTEQGLAARWARARSRFTAPVAATASVAGLVVAGAGGFIYYNTNVLNTFGSAAQSEARSVAYEKRYAATARVPQPTVTHRRFRIELYPAKGTATVEATDVYVNRSRGPIDTLHVETAEAVETGPLRFDRPATLVSDDRELRHRVVKLQTPLAPGEAVGMSYTLRFGGHGFGNGGIDASISPHASHFDDGWMPVLGYQRSRELGNPVARREAGLPARPQITPVTDVAARYDLRGRERVRIDTTIGTAADQTAIAPGQLQGSWTRGGRRYFHYITPTPLANNFGIYSARYAQRDTRWRDVAIRVYYHPTHVANVARMEASARASLEHYSRVLGPFPAKQLVLVEAPAYAMGAHSDPASVRYYEAFALLDPEADWRKVDFVFAVIAHEMAHQWWGAQVAPAPVAGAPFVGESLAWYSAMGVIGEAKGAAHRERFTDVLREDNLDPRARDGVPLLEAADWFTAYRVGPFSMVALRDAIGEDRVDLALQRFLRKYGSAQPPMPTSLDLYAEFKAVTPPAQHALLADLFERNTFWNLRTQSATSRKVGDAWEVTMEVIVDKVSIDREGRQTVRPVREPIEIGVYGPGTDEAPGKLLYLAKHSLKDGDQRVTVRVPSQPGRAGIDPRNVLIDTRRSDNLVPVQAMP